MNTDLGLTQYEVVYASREKAQVPIWSDVSSKDMSLEKQMASHEETFQRR